MKIRIKNSEGILEKEIPVDTSKTLLKQIEESGVMMHSACHAGICGACICTIEGGEQYINKSFRTEPGFPLADDEVMTCIGGAQKDIQGDIVLRKIY